MGEIMTKLTVKDWCETNGVSPDSLRMAFPKIGLSSFAQNRELTPTEIRAIEAYPFRGRKNKSVSEKRAAKAAGEKSAAPPVSERPEKNWHQLNIKLPSAAQVKNALIAGLLVGGVLGHAGLIWYDCVQLWGTPGLIGGGMMAAIVFAAVLLASDADKFSTSGDALVFVFFVDGAAWFVHYEVFRTPIVSNIITGSLCAFICAASFFALYLYRQFKFA